MQPPISNFSVLEFSKYLEIEKIGYEYAKPLLTQWKQELLNNSPLKARSLFKDTGAELKI